MPQLCEYHDDVTRLGSIRNHLADLGFLMVENHAVDKITVHLHPLKSRAIVLFGKDADFVYEYQWKNYQNAIRRS